MLGSIQKQLTVVPKSCQLPRNGLIKGSYHKLHLLSLALLFLQRVLLNFDLGEAPRLLSSARLSDK